VLYWGPGKSCVGDGPHWAADPKVWL